MNLDYTKLLNRKPIFTDTQTIKDFIKGKRILVTGGAGSIGSEIVRQLVKFNASSVTVYDNAEASMFHLEQEISKDYPKSHIKYVIGDVRDKYRLEEVFESFKPNVVFHAAAYKHVPMMEANHTSPRCTFLLLSIWYNSRYNSTCMFSILYWSRDC